MPQVLFVGDCFSGWPQQRDWTDRTQGSKREFSRETHQRLLAAPAVTPPAEAAAIRNLHDQWPGSYLFIDALRDLAAVHDARVLVSHLGSRGSSARVAHASEEMNSKLPPVILA